MARNMVSAGKWYKLAFASLGAGALAVPLAMALAQGGGPEMQQDAAAAPTEAALTAEQVVQGRTLFNSWSCNACHALTDANAHGHIGPSLDGNTALDKAFVEGRIINGQGAMPGFGGQLTDDEISLLAAYVVQAKQ